MRLTTTATSSTEEDSAPADLAQFMRYFHGGVNEADQDLRYSWAKGPKMKYYEADGSHSQGSCFVYRQREKTCCKRRCKPLAHFVDREHT
jgi:hypothetical protein